MAESAVNLGTSPIDLYHVQPTLFCWTVPLDRVALFFLKYTVQEVGTLLLIRTRSITGKGVHLTYRQGILSDHRKKGKKSSTQNYLQ
jgi:hypothetical protein